MRDIIYEIQYRHYVQRGHCLLHEKESLEEHLLSNSLYLPIHLEIALIFLNHYQTTFNPYWTSIELQSNVYQTIVEPLSNMYWTSIRSLLNHYRTSIERLLNNIKHLLNIYQTSIESLLNIY